MTDLAAPRESPNTIQPAGTTAIDTNVAQSVQAATQALGHLEQSLRAAGFPEGTSAYERMAEVLLAQWVAQGGADSQRSVDFERLGEVAGRVFGILHPYVVVMRRLAALAPDDGDRARAAVVVELQRRGRRGASPSVLTRATGLSPSLVESAIARLIADGAVQPRGADSAPYFVIADPDEPHDRHPRRSGLARSPRTRTPRTPRGRQ